MNRSPDSLDAIELAGHVRHSEDHLIATIRGPLHGPTLITLGGIHGNEPAGVLAATREPWHVLCNLRDHDRITSFNCRLMAIGITVSLDG